MHLTKTTRIYISKNNYYLLILNFCSTLLNAQLFYYKSKTAQQSASIT